MPYRPTFDRVFTLEVWIAAIVFFIVVILMSYALLRSRSRAQSSRRHEWKALELSYVVALVGIGGFLVWTSLSANADEHPTSSSPGKPLVVDITAFQWCWRFHYPSAHIDVTNTCYQGRALPTMVVPTGRPIEIRLTSSDVIHEWWVPQLAYKQEALPNWTNTFNFTLSQTGNWIGRCAEFCGLLHSDMDFRLEAVTPQEFRSWSAAHAGTTTA